MNRWIKIVVATILFLILALVRYYQDGLFYDPLLPYFSSNFSSEMLPELIVPKYYFHLTFRYLINTIISLAILWVLFRKLDIVKISAVIYVIFFFILMPLMIVSVNFFEVGEYQLLFYVRRFLIQPLLLLLLIPAFYFVKK